MRGRRGRCLWLVATLAACGPGGQQAGPGTPRESAMDAMIRFSGHLGARRLEAAARMFGTEAQWLEPGRAPIATPDSIHTFLQAHFEGVTIDSVTMQPYHVEGSAAGHDVTMLGDFRHVLRDGRGHRGVEWGRYVALWRTTTAGEWRLRTLLLQRAPSDAADAGKR